MDGCTHTGRGGPAELRVHACLSGSDSRSPGSVQVRSLPWKLGLAGLRTGPRGSPFLSQEAALWAWAAALSPWGRRPVATEPCHGRDGPGAIATAPLPAAPAATVRVVC